MTGGSFSVGGIFVWIASFTSPLEQQPQVSSAQFTPIAGVLFRHHSLLQYRFWITALHTYQRTQIWQGKIFHDLSPLQAGEEVVARCRMDSAGNLIAVDIWANLTNFYAVITKVDGDRLEVFTNPNADPQSAYKKQRKIVVVDADTVFQSGAKTDLKVGRGVQVVGLYAKDGKVTAIRLTIYEGNRPVQMEKVKALAANGTTSVLPN